MEATKELEEAKAYLRKRLTAEQSMMKGLTEALLTAANRLLNVYRKYGYSLGDKTALLNPGLVAEVENILKKLKEELYEDVELLCIEASKEDKDFLIAMINAEVYGMTLTQRISKWVEDFGTWVAGMAMIGTARLASVPMGSGAPSALGRLLRHTIAIAWSQEELRKHPEATGFYSRRGSSYPCSHCDGEVGWHPISEYPLGGWHPNCVCIFTFTYGDEVNKG